MSGNTPNRNPGVPGRASNSPAQPRHGRIPSATRFFDPITTPSRDPYPQGPASPPQGHAPIPTVVRHTDDAPTNLQQFHEGSITPFCRWAFAINDGKHPGEVRSNHNYDPDIDNAIWWSETIDAFDRDPRLIHELVLRIANQNLGHTAMEPIRQNRAMVEMLLYRHYQRHGGILLPPMRLANEALYSHQRAVEASGLRPDHPNCPRIQFPSWSDYLQSPEGQARLNAGPSQKSPTPKGKGRGPAPGGMGDPYWRRDHRGPPGGGGAGGGSGSGWGHGPSGGGGISI